MGTPERQEEFVAFDLKDDGVPYSRLYVSREIWDVMDPKAQELIFHIQDYGRFRLRISR